MADRRAQRQRRQQLLEAARSRYPALSYQEKGALVNELVDLSGFHRKSVLRLLRQPGTTAKAAADQPGDDGSTAGSRPLCAGWSVSPPPYTRRHGGTAACQGAHIQ